MADEVPRHPTAIVDYPENVHGVLLCDEIYRYCTAPTHLIDPETFDPAMLRPAGYDLRLGKTFYSQGKMAQLSAASPLLIINPYELVVASTLEKLNMPRYLIGRWSIRVTLVYRGLLLVTGQQVDPGFTGHLFYTLFNFSTREVQLKYKDPIAMIDFVKTTHFNEERMEAFFQEEERRLRERMGRPSKINWRFQQNKFDLKDYLPPYELRSAPEELNKRSVKTEEKVDTFRASVTTVLTIIIGVLGLGVALGGLLLTQVVGLDARIRDVVEKTLREKQERFVPEVIQRPPAQEQPQSKGPDKPQPPTK